MNVRFYIDPETEAPHIHKHGVDEEEVVDVLSPGEDRPGREDSRVVIGKTPARYLCFRTEPESVFVITAYELGGKPLFAYRRRLRKKGRR
jgi:hypothetical protein